MNSEIVHIVITPDERRERTTDAMVEEAINRVRAEIKDCLAGEHANATALTISVQADTGEQAAPRGAEDVQRDIDQVRGRSDKSFDRNIPSARTRKG